MDTEILKDKLGGQVHRPRRAGRMRKDYAGRAAKGLARAAAGYNARYIAIPGQQR